MKTSRRSLRLALSLAIAHVVVVILPFTAKSAIA
jgi:hypothetical protein